MRMDRLEELALVAWDSANWAVYDYTEVVRQYRDTRRVRAERKVRADKGRKRCRDGSPEDEEAGDADPEPSDDSDGGIGASVSSGTQGLPYIVLRIAFFCTCQPCTFMVLIAGN